MKHQTGYRWTRYFLVGVLVSGMAVNSAAARRLFQRRSPACNYQPTCVEVCPEVCPDVIVTEPCGCSQNEVVDYSLVDNSPCAPATNFTEIHSESVPLDVGQYVGEYVGEQTYVGEQIIEASPAPVEWSEPTEQYVPAEVVESPLFENPAADLSYQPIEPATPLATPEVPLPETNELAAPPVTVPDIAGPPEATGVGDRYSNNNDLLPPATPEEAPVPTPAPIQEAPAQEEKVEAEPPATESGMDDLFDEPIVPPTEDKQPESPLPAPQPQPEVDDLFGPLESPEAAELTETSKSVEPEALKEAPAEPASTDTDADTDDTDDTDDTEADPFHEDWTTGLDHQNLTLEKAGGLLSKTERTWTDNTASFQCEARLLRVTAKNVVLRQATGAQRVVPLARLANVDLQFVRNQITALRVVRARDAAAEKLLAVVWGK